MKQAIKKALLALGLEIRRVPKKKKNQYFNTGELTPLEENSEHLYDQFYGDEEALETYYKGQRLKFYQAVINCLAENVSEIETKDVLDAGCGVGYLLSALTERLSPKSLSGSDFSEEAVKASRKRFDNIEFFRHDINDPLHKKYDIILCTEVLEHLEKPYVALEHLKNALNPEGHIMLTVPDGRADTINEHINFWSPESWKAFLQRECPQAQILTGKLMDGPFNYAILNF